MQRQRRLSIVKRGPASSRARISARNRVRVARQIVNGQYWNLFTNLLAEVIRSAGTDRHAMTQIGQGKIVNSVSPVCLADQSEQGGVLFDRQKLPIAQCVSMRRIIECDRFDFAEKWSAAIRWRTTVRSSGDSTVIRNSPRERDDVSESQSRLAILNYLTTAGCSCRVGEQKQNRNRQQKNRQQRNSVGGSVLAGTEPGNMPKLFRSQSSIAQLTMCPAFSQLPQRGLCLRVPAKTVVLWR